MNALPRIGGGHFLNFFIAFVFLASIAIANAQSITAPVPRSTIYPGDRIDRSMLIERSIAGSQPTQGIVESADELVGKVARRTLLPDQPIQTIAIENPRLVTLGSRTKIVFSENGIVITGFGIAQQAGSLGDIIQVRNLDSGMMVVGRVQKDGSVLVSEG